MRKPPAVKAHPALALLHHEAKDYLVRFQTDLTVHDAAALATHNATDAFAWILHTGATYMTFMGPEHRKYKVGRMFVGAYGADETRFFFWDGRVLTRFRSAHDLDERIEEYEHELRDRKRRADLADRGIA